MTIEEHINGLKGIKPYLQKKMLEINYEGLGELDAQQVGETIDFAIKSIKEVENSKKELVEIRKTTRPQGRWISPTKNTDFSNRDFFSDCSICGHTQMEETNFCPNCGADMRQEANEND